MKKVKSVSIMFLMAITLVSFSSISLVSGEITENEIVQQPKYLDDYEFDHGSVYWSNAHGTIGTTTGSNPFEGSKALKLYDSPASSSYYYLHDYVNNVADFEGDQISFSVNIRNAYPAYDFDAQLIIYVNSESHGFDATNGERVDFGDYEYNDGVYHKLTVSTDLSYSGISYIHVYIWFFPEGSNFKAYVDSASMASLETQSATFNYEGFEYSLGTPRSYTADSYVSSSVGLTQLYETKEANTDREAKFLVTASIYLKDETGSSSKRSGIKQLSFTATPKSGYTNYDKYKFNYPFIAEQESGGETNLLSSLGVEDETYDHFVGAGGELAIAFTPIPPVVGKIEAIYSAWHDGIMGIPASRPGVSALDYDGQGASPATYVLDIEDQIGISKTTKMYRIIVGAILEVEYSIDGPPLELEVEMNYEVGIYEKDQDCWKIVGWFCSGWSRHDTLSNANPQKFSLLLDGTEPPSLGDAVDNTQLYLLTGGNANWDGQTIKSYYGGDAAQSGDIGNSQSTDLQTTVTGAETVSFYWKVSSENNYDYLRFYIDGVEQAKISGEVDWQYKSYSLGSGTHILQWSYTKDSSVSRGSDTSWVDKIVVSYPPPPPPPCFRNFCPV